ncbi:MAG: hypothetical protein J3Q66DRAFT_414181 [Benniella sp.]|nr:MAG: hypothetical protein J3Q66DRAFT_414181 [Benniella sp.]
MFGIPELDELVFPQLNRHELARCMRVNKKWYEAAVPFLWNDLTCLENLSWDQRQAFSTLVQEDYLQVQQHRKEGGQDMGQHASPISNLAKYGRYVRLLAPMWDLIALLETNTMAQLSLPSDLSPAVIERVLPRVLDLEIRSRQKSVMKAQSLMELLDHFTSTLGTLKMNVVLKDPKAEMNDQQEEETPSPKGWMSLTHLKLVRWGDHSGYTMLRRWLLRRCSYVQKIEVCQDSLISQRFVEDALTYMPNLKEVVMRDGGLQDHNNAAAILSASRYGWRSVTIGYPSLGKAARMSLASHFSTLEMLDVSQWYHHERRLDPITGLLNTWACETSLKVLDTNVKGIPSSGNQGLVYDRLARLAHLETIVMAMISLPDVLSCPEFTLESGLHKLAGLKSLERLDVWCLGVRLGLEEVQWMAEHWPSLRLLQARVEDEACTLNWLKEHHPLISLEGKD